MSIDWHRLLLASAIVGLVFSITLLGAVGLGVTLSLSNPYSWLIPIAYVALCGTMFLAVESCIGRQGAMLTCIASALWNVLTFKLIAHFALPGFAKDIEPLSVQDLTGGVVLWVLISAVYLLIFVATRAVFPLKQVRNR